MNVDANRMLTSVTKNRVLWYLMALLDIVLIYFGHDRVQLLAHLVDLPLYNVDKDLVIKVVICVRDRALIWFPRLDLCQTIATSTKGINNQTL